MGFIKLINKVFILFIFQSIGDDNIMYKWNTVNNQASKYIELDSYVIDHDWISHSKGSS